MPAATNSFDSNFTRKLAKVFLKKFEAARVLSKNVDTQLLQGRFGPDSGENVDFKRPTDYTTSRSPTGDATGISEDIITGKATGTIQDYFTNMVDFYEADQAVKMDQLDQLLAPMATRIATDLEVDFASFMMKNAGLFSGDETAANYGASVDTWDDVANAGAVMMASGVPQDADWCYAVNPFTQKALASNQRSLGSGGVSGSDISEAHRKAIITDNYAGMKVMSATTLQTYTSGAYGGDLAGTVSSVDVTYATAKDTMTQSVVVAGIGTFTGTIPAGTVWQIAGRNRLNMSTRQPIVDAAGNNILWTATQTADASFTTGGGTIILTGPGIYEAGGAYNTTDSAIAAADVITVMGAVSTLYQPNLFWHKQAFSIGSVPIQKLYSTDTIAETEDGLQLRVSKFADGVTNVQKVRFDLRPAYAVLNPFFAGQSFGLVA